MCNFYGLIHPINNHIIWVKVSILNLLILSIKLALFSVLSYQLPDKQLNCSKKHLNVL